VSERVVLCSTRTDGAGRRVCDAAYVCVCVLAWAAAVTPLLVSPLRRVVWVPPNQASPTLEVMRAGRSRPTATPRPPSFARCGRPGPSCWRRPPPSAPLSRSATTCECNGPPRFEMRFSTATVALEAAGRGGCGCPLLMSGAAARCTVLSQGQHRARGAGAARRPGGPELLRRDGRREDGPRAREGHGRAVRRGAPGTTFRPLSPFTIHHSPGKQCD
jgi:hypothetical protein